MSRWQDAPVVGGAYSDDTRPWTCQDTVNYIPVRTERPGGRSEYQLRSAPGFYMVADTGSHAPIRGMHNVEGTLLVVAGTTLYKVGLDFACTAVGSIPGVLRVSMAHNQIAGGNQVAIANGNAGYVYDTVNGTLSQITDEAFPGASSFDFVDGYITFIDPSRNFAGTSDLADATSYSTLDRYQAEGSPDKLVGQIVDHREWWLFGERTIEPYQNTGASTGTFQRSGGTVIDVGAASPYAIAKIDNSVIWLGNDGIVYRANGYTPVRISTFPMDQAISRCTLSSAFAFTYEDRGHKIFYLTLQDGQTWGYDVAMQEWHRRASRGLDRWRLNDLVFWNGMWIGGDFANGKLYRLDWNVMQEDGEIMERLRVTGVLHDSQNQVIVNGVALVFDTGNKAVNVPYKPALKVIGDLPDGSIGSSGTMQYILQNAVGVAKFSIYSGSLPPGAEMSESGLVTFDYSTTGIYGWVVRGEDSERASAMLGDTANVNGTDPQLSDWRYFVTLTSDDTDRSGVSYDDSGWPLGKAPFGNLTGDPQPGINAHAFDPGFSATIATQIPGSRRLWMRRVLTLGVVPTAGFELVGYFDNSYKFYVNGVLASDGSTGTNDGVIVPIDASFFQLGENHIALECDDFAPPCYFDFYLRNAP